MGPVKIGTCSWNYPSWVGLLYSKKRKQSSEYLDEYAKTYPTVEIDSWFYKIPNEKDVLEYMRFVSDEFTFSCKVTNTISLTHLRFFKEKKKLLKINPDFLSVELFNRYINAIRPMLCNIGVIMLEFEYLSLSKMSSMSIFLNLLERFFQSIDIKNIPLAIETRNKNYLQKEYFELLKEYNVGHVFSEKMYLPHIYKVYELHKDLLNDLVTIRLLGGDRKEIEEKTNGKWNKIVDEKKDINIICDMIKDMSMVGKSIHVYVNNHYEGSAPLTIKKIKDILGNNR